MNSTFNKRLTLILSIVSAAVGAGFGLMGQMWYVNDGSDSFFYTDVDLPLGVGIGLGMVLGFASGWFYSAGISVIAGRYKQRGPIVGWGTLLGIVVGLGCSTVFHLILRQKDYCLSKL